VELDFGHRAARPEDRRPVAEIQFHRANGWVLTNLGLPDLRVAGGGAVKRIGLNQPVTLDHGQQLILGSGPTTRLATVTMQALQN
jgi:hypothetical protein